MERLTQEAQIGPFASLRDKAEAKPRAFNDYDCFLAHARAVTALKAYEDICFDENGKERITVAELSALVKARDEGRVLISPIALEQKIYKHSPLKSGVLEWTVIQIMKSQTGFDFEIISNSGITHRVSDEDIGKTVFLTRAEAEVAIGGGGDGV